MYNNLFDIINTTLSKISVFLTGEFFNIGFATVRAIELPNITQYILIYSIITPHLIICMYNSWRKTSNSFGSYQKMLLICSQLLTICAFIAYNYDRCIIFAHILLCVLPLVAYSIYTLFVKDLDILHSTTFCIQSLIMVQSYEPAIAYYIALIGHVLCTNISSALLKCVILLSWFICMLFFISAQSAILIMAITIISITYDSIFKNLQYQSMMNYIILTLIYMLSIFCVMMRFEHMTIILLLIGLNTILPYRTICPSFEFNLLPIISIGAIYIFASIWSNIIIRLCICIAILILGYLIDNRVFNFQITNPNIEEKNFPIRSQSIYPTVISLLVAILCSNSILSITSTSYILYALCILYGIYRLSFIKNYYVNIGAVIVFCSLASFVEHMPIMYIAFIIDGARRYKVGILQNIMCQLSFVLSIPELNKYFQIEHNSIRALERFISYLSFLYIQTIQVLHILDLVLISVLYTIICVIGSSYEHLSLSFNIVNTIIYDKNVSIPSIQWYGYIANMLSGSYSILMRRINKTRNVHSLKDIGLICTLSCLMISSFNIALPMYYLIPLTFINVFGLILMQATIWNNTSFYLMYIIVYILHLSGVSSKIQYSVMITMFSIIYQFIVSSTYTKLIIIIMSSLIFSLLS